jgi:hypothetical protein
MYEFLCSAMQAKFPNQLHLLDLITVTYLVRKKTDVLEVGLHTAKYCTFHIPSPKTWSLNVEKCDLRE